MKILAQNYKTGELEMLEVPMMTSIKGLLVKTMASLVSVGTEKAMIEVAQKSLLGKALARPDWVKQVIDKIKTEGLMEAWQQSQARLDTPVPLGYSCAGIVTNSGTDISESGFSLGDRVACGGSGHASHAEYNVVLPNLCVKIPDNVSFEDASYVALGGIALEAVRLAKVELGYRVGVIGLGLLGQLAVQILRAAGCHVFGVDVVPERCDRAYRNGAETVALIGNTDPIAFAQEFSNFEGLDAVIIFASVDSDEPLLQAASMCRERGKIVAGGLVRLHIPREFFYKKELEFAVSRAWGPGMYDPDYEERGIKYPLAYVRWTAQRNMEEFLTMVSLGSVKLDTITTHRFPFGKALEAYQMILGQDVDAVGVILHYDPNAEVQTQRMMARENDSDRISVSDSVRKSVSVTKSISKSLSVRVKKWLRVQKAKFPTLKYLSPNTITNTDTAPAPIGIGLIGAGLFARGTILPELKKIKEVAYSGVATATGLSGQHIAKKYKFDYATTDYHALLADPNVKLVFILTRHDSHAHLVCEALKAGKAVFVEKPLCITKKQLTDIIAVYTSFSSSFLMVGFNRRFAPATKQCVNFLGSSRLSGVVQIRCNAGFIPPESWVHKRDEGGGRIIGEVCHFVDLAQAITGGLPQRVFASAAESPQGLRDNLAVSLKMDNGAVASITYASHGDKSFPREEVQAFAGGSVCVIENFRTIRFISAGKKIVHRALRVDRGHREELQSTIAALTLNEPSPIDFKSLVATTLATFAIEESLSTGEAIEINLGAWGIH
jgi:predicted dehydrogenase/threonine dehydrogenase-like Zn-dependent dehydrogenase